MTGPSAWVLLLAAATVVDGVLAGASLDQSIKQLPARHRLGMRAFSAYSQASDQANGLVWYAGLGIGSALLTIAAGAWALTLSLSADRLLPVILAGGFAIAHSLTTARAAPINWSQRAVPDDEVALARIFHRFARWQALRGTLQLATFLLMVWALIVNAPRVFGI
jgi:hypothetical protein